MASNIFCVIIILALCLSKGLLVFANADVATLTDANFEHDTQATTGSTTGRWLVVFHDKHNYDEVQKLLKEPQGGSEGEEESNLVDDLLEAGGMFLTKLMTYLLPPF